jgi:GNAT superfamily N-acetyltransferase
VGRAVTDETTATAPPGYAFRHPTEADYPAIVGVVDEWWGGRRMRAMLQRVWFQHFTGTSWILESGDGRLAGFVVAFVSQDDPTTGYVKMIAADPNRRRIGLGRALYERVFADMRARGVRRVQAITWPGNRVSVDFHRSMGFDADAGEGSMRWSGTPAYPDYDGEGEDRAVFTRQL